MTPFLFLAPAVAGGLGAASRLLHDGVLGSRAASRLPIGTIAINLSGSLLPGLLSGWVARGTLSQAWALVAGSGFLGGYITSSTSNFETLRQLQEDERAFAVLTRIGLVIDATAAAGLGLWLVGR